MSARVQTLTRLRTIQPTIRGSSSQPFASKLSGACNPFHLPFQYRSSRAVHVAAGNVPPPDGPHGKQNEQEDQQPAVNDTIRNQTSTDLPEEDVEVVIQYYERSKKKPSAGKKRGKGAEASGSEPAGTTPDAASDADELAAAAATSIENAVQDSAQAAEETTKALSQLAGAAEEAFADAVAKEDAEPAATEPQSPPSSPQVDSASPPVRASTGGTDSTPFSNQPADSRIDDERVAHLQRRLLFSLASLDRGFAATSDDVTRMDNLVRQLEAAGGAVVLTNVASEPTRMPLPGSELDASASSSSATEWGKATTRMNKTPLQMLDGRWRLVFSSGFASGSLGGRRPGPPSALVPLTLGQVYQDINLAAEELDNVVNLSSKLSLASLPWVNNATVPSINARLKHSVEILGANTIRITYDRTVVKLSGGLSNWLDSLPNIETPKLRKVDEALRSSTKSLRGRTFDVTFLDDSMRITRGDRGELRIFLKEYDASMKWEQEE